MIDILMLSNKSQYILSKIGIPLYQDNTKSLIKQESAIHFYQKDSILTLHLISVDKCSEKEINLLEAIMGSMKGEQASESHGEFTFVEGESVRCEKILNNSHPIKATLVFFDTKLLSTDANCIESPPLIDMLSDPTLKKNLWAQIKLLDT